jgi:hypothetical protein
LGSTLPLETRSSHMAACPCFAAVWSGVKPKCLSRRV